jgi:ribosomal protein S18 acetylase RimI-like enzyme
MTIRQARQEDIPHIVELIRGLADFEKLPGPDDGAADRLAAHLLEERFGLLVADEGGAIVGYALYFFTYSTFRAQPSLYLEDLYVDPKQRSRGIGEALLRRVATIAVAEGCGRFEWTVLDWNIRAQAFYKRMGAEMHEQWRICRVDGEALDRLGAAAV